MTTKQRQSSPKDARQIERFSKELTRRIQELGMTRPQVGNLLNMRASTVQSYCGGHARPSRRNLQKLAQLFGEDLLEFFSDGDLVGPATPPLQIMPLTTDFARVIVRVEVVTNLDTAQRLRRVLVDAGLIDSTAGTLAGK